MDKCPAGRSVAYRERVAAADRVRPPARTDPRATAATGFGGGLREGIAIGPGHRRAGGVLLAALLAIALGLSPAAAQPALAAGTLRLEADTTYTLDPDAGRVHVEIEVKATSLKPNSASFIYFYREIGFPLQPEASKIRASDGSGGITITTKKHESFIEAVVRLRSPIYYQESDRFTIRYDLVGGEPRSESPTRVGKAFATFGVWSWGDVGRSTVTVKVPKGFETEVAGEPLAIRTTADGETLTATPEEPDTFFSIVSAENRDAYADTRLSFEGGVEIVVLAWPEDDAWQRTVGSTMREGIPELRRLIGLDWPVAHDLNVRERYTPALEGFAGIFFTDDQRIDVSEDLDRFVIVHEASHAWLNESLFGERWIYEGLADEYAWQVLTAVGEDPEIVPERPDVEDPGHVTLNAWRFPQVIRDQKTDDRERYGYNASFWVMHQVVAAAGLDHMRAAFEAASAKTTAYIGAGAPEKVTGENDWKRFLDLVEPIDEPEPAAVEAAIRDLAVSKVEARPLEGRAAARARYRDLIKAGDGWLPPWAVRKLLSGWSFIGANTYMDAAFATLQLRDQVAAAASALGLEPDGALRTAYEGAQASLAAASELATEQLSALASVADAKAKVEATPDFLTQLGLIGETPNVPYEAARTAFEAGDLDGAVTSATGATALITGAAAIGQQRLIIGVVVAVGVLVLLIVLVMLLRRRGQRRRLGLATANSAVAPVEGSIESLAVLDARLAPPAESTTLAADPASEPPPPSASPPDDHGGPQA